VMSEVTYRIVEHDGGFAYKVGDVFSETFPSREEALQAAQAAASAASRPVPCPRRAFRRSEAPQASPTTPAASCACSTSGRGIEMML
ncbi:hypothetical protein OMR07_24045, partial [Methylobacterium organophilum]|nr:hypothetical protein [Methylobacterium organophilum]